jgi:hypothetical protein
MRGFVWLDRGVRESSVPAGLPAIKISSDTSGFPYTHRRGHRSAIRISRIVSETFRLGLPDVRWFVMGDDDTIFLPDNLLAVLNKFDHRQPYYIGSLSESHLQNIYFSYGMAYGGGGFAISRPLAESLARIQDGCIRRYPALYGSDDRIQACMAELGVPLTKHPGFHQYDVYGDLLGLLAAHPGGVHAHPAHGAPSRELLVGAQDAASREKLRVVVRAEPHLPPLPVVPHLHRRSAGAAAHGPHLADHVSVEGVVRLAGPGEVVDPVPEESALHLPDAMCSYKRAHREKSIRNI